jgi:hypothetical protein
VEHCDGEVVDSVCQSLSSFHSILVPPAYAGPFIHFHSPARIDLSKLNGHTGLYVI